MIFHLYECKIETQNNIILKLANVLIKIYNDFGDKTKWDKLFPIINNVLNIM